MTILQLYELFKYYGLRVGLPVVGLTIIVFLVRLIFDEDRSALFRAKVYKALLAATGKREHEKKYLANDLRGKINLARRKIHYGKQAIPQAVRLEWVEGTNPHTYDIADNEFVIRLDPSEAQSKNILRMVEAVVCRTTFVGIKHLLEKPLHLALNLTLIRKLLAKIQNQNALDEFYSNYYPKPGLNDSFDEWNSFVTKIDDQGLYERLLIVELEDFSRRILGMEPKYFMVGEIEKLVRFVYEIATREEGVEIPLSLKRAHINLGIILVAKAQKILEQGISPYIEAMRINIEQKGREAIYLIIWDKLHMRSLKDFIKYTNRCAQLQRAIGKQFNVIEHFNTKYSYVDPNGYRREGQIIRFIPTDS